MGLFDKITGKKTEKGLDDSETITGYMPGGAKILLPRSSYKKDFLKKIEDSWNNKDEVYTLIVLGLQDNFFDECIKPAEKLYQIEKHSERSSTVLGIALMKTGRLNDAEAVFQKYLKEKGASGVILTNLAKIFSERRDVQKSYETLWAALKVDPNQNNALSWWRAIHAERNELDKFYASLDELTQIIGSWHPQLYIALRLLEKNDVEGAKAIYRKVLEVAGNESDALMSISGDLGNHGYAQEALDLILPKYNPEKHGIETGVNLIHACINVGDRVTGLQLCNAVSKLERYDYVMLIDELRQKLKQ